VYVHPTKGGILFFRQRKKQLTNSNNNEMNIHDIKQISITGYLQRHGYTPAQTKGINHWYYSPFRQEQTPSFKVNTERNLWYDFGTGEHGDIIDLVCALNR
jgi:DNA primase